MKEKTLEPVWLVELRWRHRRPPIARLGGQGDGEERLCPATPGECVVVAEVAGPFFRCALGYNQPTSLSSGRALSSHAFWTS